MIATGLVSRTEHDDIRERFELITKATNRIGLLYQAAFLGLLVLVTMFSYAFVLQSAFDPPVEDIYTNNSIEEFSTDGGYILERADGSCSLVLSNGDIFENINGTALRIFLDEGLEIRKE